MKILPPLIIGNWKMNPTSSAEARQLFAGVKKAAKRYHHATVVVAPPTIFISELARLSTNSLLNLGVQNVHPAPAGAQTGEISLSMVIPFNVKYCIIGHSERRALGETDEMVARKVESVLKQRLTPVVCIGERERDNQGNFFLQIEAQLKTLLEAVPKNRYKDLVIAYEPIWAIGTGQTATVDDVVEMQLFIQKVITKYVSRNAASLVRFMYGGSVHGGNAAVLYESGAVGGFLVGGASLNIEEFTKIIAATT